MDIFHFRSFSSFVLHCPGIIYPAFFISLAGHW
ncbi:MAG: hypothetical protein JWR05_790, partial [Mucilaginibacter sp.]|nr:hypothetical protein [Mucilaginibacter sp.]